MQTGNALARVGICWALLAGSAAESVSALESLRRRDAEIRSILAQFSSEEGRRLRLYKALDSSFDYPEHAQRCFGNLWDEMSPEQKNEGLALVTKLLRASSAESVEKYQSEGVEYLSETRLGEGEMLVVTTVKKELEEWQIKYDLKLGDHWRIVDVIIEGASTVESNRSAFLREARQSSLEGLLRKLRAKAEALER